MFAFAPLHAGALVPGIDEPNLKSPEQVTVAISAALGDVHPRSRDVTLVLPDTAVRVFVLDFDSLPAKPADVIPVLKFRLRKMVPFDVEHAGVSYQVLSTSSTETRALIAVLPGPILAEYEAAVRAAGYEPGAVLPSSLAALAALDARRTRAGGLPEAAERVDDTGSRMGRIYCCIARWICLRMRSSGYRMRRRTLLWLRPITKTRLVPVRASWHFMAAWARRMILRAGCRSTIRNCRWWNWLRGPLRERRRAWAD